MADEKPKVYSTRDIYLASTLMTLGFGVVNVDFQVEGQRGRPVGYFNFEDTDNLRRAETDFLRGAIRVEPRALFTSMKALKGLVNNVYKSPSSPYNKGNFR